MLIYPIPTHDGLGQYKFKGFAYLALLSCVSHFIDICTVAIKYIRNMHAVSTNQIADILHFNDKACYLIGHMFKGVQWRDVNNTNMMTRRNIRNLIFAYPNICVGS